MPTEIHLTLIEPEGASKTAMAGLTEMFAHASRLLVRAGRAPLRLERHRPTNLPPRPGVAVIVPPAFASRAYLAPPAPLTRWLAALPDRTLIASACAGAFYLGAAGLLDGHRVTTHWALGPDLARRFPRARVDTSACLLRDGRLITAGGLMSWTDLALELIGEFSSPALLHEVARHFVIDSGRRAQSAYRDFTPPEDHGDAPILRAQLLLARNIARAPRLPELAAHAGLAPRSFQRRFARATGMTPRAYVQNLRMAAARAALETGTDTIEQIAWSVGYENTNAFRKVFRRHAGLSPSSFRRRNQR